MRGVRSCGLPKQAVPRALLKRCSCQASPQPRRSTTIHAGADDPAPRLTEAESSALKHPSQAPVPGFQVAVFLIQQWTYSFVISQSSSSIIASLLRLDISALDADQLAASALLAQALQISGSVFLLTKFCEKQHTPLTQTLQYRWDHGKPVLLAAAAAGTIICMIFVWSQLANGATDADLAGAAQHISLLTYVSIFLAPISEELLFRGIILGWLLKCWRGPFTTPMSIAASAVSFSAFHASSEDFVPLTLFGVVIGAAYCSSSLPSTHISDSDSEKELHDDSNAQPLNLVVPTLAHMMYNGFVAAANLLG